MSVHLRAFLVADTEQVVTLWRRAGLTRPWNDPYRDIERKLTVQPDLFLVAVDGPEPHDGTIHARAPGGVVVGSVMAGYDGHRGWLYYLAVDPSRTGQGIGRALVAAAEHRLIALGCPKVQLMVRPDNTSARGFYDALGYESFDTYNTGKRLIADD